MTSTLEPLERGLGDLAGCARAGCRGRACLPSRIDVEAELGGDHHLAAERRERLADQLLVGERAVDLGGVEEGDAALDGRADQRDPLLPVDRRAVAEAQAHAAEADGRDLQAARSQFALLHCSSSSPRLWLLRCSGLEIGHPALVD